jgi:medium-chain acyl-[acyl-carrier-protein] hydrolase
LEASNMVNSGIVQTFRDNLLANATVYGIAHSGGGAAPWHSVSAAADETIEVRGIRLAGREKRIGTPPYRSVAEAATDVATAIRDDARLWARPIFLAGSCSGAVIARAAAEHLTGAFRPVGLLAIRQQAPSAPPPAGRPDLCSMGNAALRAWIRELRLMAPELLEDDDVFRYFEPALRADLEITEPYIHTGPPLDCPVFVSNLAGGAAAHALWEQETTAEVTVVAGPDSGDFLLDHPAELARQLASAVAISLESRTSRSAAAGRG